MSLLKYRIELLKTSEYEEYLTLLDVAYACKFKPAGYMSSTVTKSAPKLASAQTKRKERQSAVQQSDDIVTKTLRMADTLKKYPKPTK